MIINRLTTPIHLRLTGLRLLSLFIPFLLLSLGACGSRESETDDSDEMVADTFDLKPKNYAAPGHKKSPVYYTPFRKLFNDLNDKHISVARRKGIEPLATFAEAREQGFWALARIDSCEYYAVDPLTHSAPYLTPKAKWLLMTIGKNFNDSLARRGSGGRQIILTSALRTDESVRSLRRRNVNASENSAHRYGTTFDITYNRYMVTDSAFTIPSDRLRILLGEVLYDLRKEQKCYIKYEVRQGCFHITAR